ncbi:MAG TPA: hypothetical protein DD420_12755 [Streptomyces sp.]|nr:hypothetical protein [Streptomyces sp.]
MDSPRRFSSVTPAVRRPTPRTVSHDRPSWLLRPARSRNGSREVIASLRGTTITRAPSRSSFAVTSGSRSMRPICLRTSRRADTGWSTPGGTCTISCAAVWAKSGADRVVRSASTRAGSEASRSRSPGDSAASSWSRLSFGRSASRAASPRTGSEATASVARNASASVVSSSFSHRTSAATAPRDSHACSIAERASGFRATPSSSSLSRTVRSGAAPDARAAR